MSIHLEISLQKLKNSLLAEAALVESQVRDAIEAFSTRQNFLAKTVIQKDKQVDQSEVDIEEFCLQILALYQPVAVDLRFVISILKINNDLERIGDIAVNIAEISLRLNNQFIPPTNIDINAMAQTAIQMLKDSIDSFISNDTNLARKICLADAELDSIHFENYSLVRKLIENDIANIAGYMQIMSLSRYIERIADLATNIAEDVIYIVDGVLVRRDKDL